MMAARWWNCGGVKRRQIWRQRDHYRRPQTPTAVAGATTPTVVRTTCNDGDSRSSRRWWRRQQLQQRRCEPEMREKTIREREREREFAEVRKNDFVFEFYPNFTSGFLAKLFSGKVSKCCVSLNCYIGRICRRINRQ